MDEQNISLIWMSATSIAQFIAGLLIKKIPVLPNETIPYLTSLVGIAGFMLLCGLGFREAVILAMATAHGATLLAETKTLAKKPGEGQ